MAREGNESFSQGLIHPSLIFQNWIGMVFVVVGVYVSPEPHK